MSAGSAADTMLAAGSGYQSGQFGSPRRPDFDNPKVGVNARLFDDFDLDAVPFTVIDGKNLW